jgi:hypothetical protein
MSRPNTTVLAARTEWGEAEAGRTPSPSHAEPLGRDAGATAALDRYCRPTPVVFVPSPAPGRPGLPGAGATNPEDYRLVLGAVNGDRAA